MGGMRANQGEAMERTVRIKIENEDLKDTTEQYFEAYKFCVNKGFELHTSSKKKLHNATYGELRKNYPKIPSALLQTVRDIACENLKAVKLKIKPIPKNKFIRFDKRTFSFKNGLISVSTINGRKKFNVSIPKYFEKYLDWNCKAGVLVLKNNQLWLNLIFNKENIVNNHPKTVLGLDRGINNIVVTSNNEFYNSKQLKAIKGRYQYLKAQLQSKGTPSAKRKLKKLSGKEKRFVRDVNHCISKKLASKDFDCYALEDLKKIPRTRGKRFNKKLGNWSFYQLENFLGYKVEELGKMVIKVNPEHTSQTCSKCGHIEKSNRNGSRFKCKSCGFELHSDLNASRNIAQIGMSELGRLSVNQPIVAPAMVATSPHSSEMGN
jgi:IS605 OrfB family transposase